MKRLYFLYWLGWVVVLPVMASTLWLYLDALFHLKYGVAVFEGCLILLNTWSLYTLATAIPPWKIATPGESWPWCSYCKSWHHPLNPTCLGRVDQ